MSFNPRPREGATRAYRVRFSRSLVSIHAPVKGRLRAVIPIPEGGSFNPRPREGATISSPAQPVCAGFNPRPREGATLSRRSCRDSTLFQSTPP